MRLLIIENDKNFRCELESFLNTYKNFEVQAFASESKNECLSLVEFYNPDLIFISSEVAENSACDIIKKIRIKSKQQYIIVICDSPKDRFQIYEYICANVQGIIEASADFHSYLSAIEAVSAGAHYYSEAILEIMRNAIQSQAPTPKGNNLTQREIDILKLIAKGLRNKEIAQYYNLSVRTVETHRFNIRKKTKANSLQDLIQIAQGITQLKRPDAYFMNNNIEMQNLAIGE